MINPNICLFITLLFKKHDEKKYYTIYLLCLARCNFWPGLSKAKLNFQKYLCLPQHYQQEYTFDTTLNPAAWTTQKKGLHVSFASTDELYFRTEVPELEKETTIMGSNRMER